ncbi:MAG: ribonuclease HI family protein [Candidatus Micrarchaeaceae archaeon]
MAKFTIYTDGAARGNPGESASGFIVISNGRIIARSESYNGHATNNYAEYTAIINALAWCKDNIADAKGATIQVYSDSELVVKQLNRMYRIRSDALRVLNKRANGMAALFGEVRFANVRRENRFIRLVDHAVNVLLDRVENGRNAAKEEII